MMAWAVFLRATREQLRRPLMLALSIMIAPFFIFVYWLIAQSWTTAITAAVVNEDRGVSVEGASFNAGALAMKALKEAVGDSGGGYRIVTFATRDEAIEALKTKRAAALLVLPDTFSATVLALKRQQIEGPISVAIVGDPSNMLYLPAVILTASTLEQFIRISTGRPPLVEWRETTVTGMKPRSDFEMSVPGLLIVAVTMLIFQAAMLIAREYESGTLLRLRLSRLSALNYYLGLTLSLLVVGLLQILAALAFAYLLGFHSSGCVLLALLLAMITCLSAIGLGLLVACFSRSEADAFILANFPLFFMMFFSGAMFPFPRPEWFVINGHGFGPLDTIAATPAVSALNRVLNTGAGLGDVYLELIVALGLSVLYFVVGVWLFHRRRFQA